MSSVDNKQGEAHSGIATTSASVHQDVKEEPQEDQEEGLADVDFWTQEQWVEYYSSWDAWAWGDWHTKAEPEEEDHAEEAAEEAEPEAEVEWDYVEDSEEEETAAASHQPEGPIKATPRPAEPTTPPPVARGKVPVPPPPPAVRPMMHVVPPPPPAAAKRDPGRSVLPPPPAPPRDNLQTAPWRRGSGDESSSSRDRATASASSSGRYVGHGHGFVLPTGQYSASLA